MSPNSAEARTIAQAVIGLVHGLGCEAVAEGIESEAQAAVLRVIGCDMLQGYARWRRRWTEDAFLDLGARCRAAADGRGVCCALGQDRGE